jgi:hypothetical protein
MRSQRKLKLSQPPHPLRIAPPHLNGHHQVLHKRSRMDLPVAATRTVHLHRGTELGGCWRFGNFLELFRWCYLVRLCAVSIPVLQSLSCRITASSHLLPRSLIEPRDCLFPSEDCWPTDMVRVPCPSWTRRIYLSHSLTLGTAYNTAEESDGLRGPIGFIIPK